MNVRLKPNTYQKNQNISFEALRCNKTIYNEFGELLEKTGGEFFKKTHSQGFLSAGLYIPKIECDNLNKLLTRNNTYDIFITREEKLQVSESFDSFLRDYESKCDQKRLNKDAKFEEYGEKCWDEAAKEAKMHNLFQSLFENAKELSAEAIEKLVQKKNQTNAEITKSLIG